MVATVVEEIEECHPEEYVKAFFDYLVEPTLNHYEGRDRPPAEMQQRVAKQMYAVVILYNYYLRQQKPYLDSLPDILFCKRSLVWNSKMVSYLGRLKGSSLNNSNHSKVQASITELNVKEACEVCESLELPQGDGIAKKWKVSKIAVLVVNESFDDCIIVENAMTEGCWSIIEIELNNSWHENDIERVLGAVNMETGIETSCLTYTGKHMVVSSTTKKQALCKFLLVVCKGKQPPKSSDGGTAKWEWVKINEVLSSFESPLIVGESPNFFAGSYVNYFQIWPYVNAIKAWKDIPNISSEEHKGNGNANLRGPNDNGIPSPSSKATVGKKENSPVWFGTQMGSGVDGEDVKHSRVKDALDKYPNSMQHNTPLFNTSADHRSAGSGKNVRAKSKEGTSNGVTDKKNPGNASCSNSVANLLKQRSALQMEHQKQVNRFSERMKAYDDQFVETLLAEGHLSEEFEKEMLCETPSGRPAQDSVEFDDSRSSSKKRRLLEGVKCMRNSLQELESLCNRNGWVMSYKTVQFEEATDGGYRSTINVTGAGFEFSTQGELRGDPRESVESAASFMMSKLYQERAGTNVS